jgi:hypothetical protein
MTKRIVAIVAVLAFCGSGFVFGQSRVGIRTAFLYEGYKFDPGLAFDEITELMIPLQAEIPVGRLASLTVSTGYVRVDLKSATEDNVLPDQSLSGMLDTQARLSFNLVEGRLVLLATSTLPTGTQSVRRDELSILGALASDIIGFSAATVGSGGDVGGGFAGAVPLGRFALGLGATYQQPFSYQPVLGLDTLLQRGSEFRGRLGLQGPLARRTFLRVTGMYVMRQKDRLSGMTQNGVGNRLVGYVSLNQGVGPAMLTLYGFDVFRSDPQIETGALGAAVLPRGNLLAWGAQLALTLGRSTTFTPRYEYRLSATAADTSDTVLRQAGLTMRFGGDIRQSLGRTVTLVIQGDGVTGHVVQAGADVGLRGFRAGMHLEITP